MTNTQIDASAAIRAALAQNWTEAIERNEAILVADPTNIEALNRLGNAYLRMGNIPQAKRTYQRVIDIDKYNQIAKRNLQNIQNIKNGELVNTAGTFSPAQFIEEPGITKVVQCINVANIQILSTLSPGQEVILKSRNHALEIRTHDGVYLGALPDDIAFRLIKLLSGGYEYHACIKSIGKNALCVFIRETKRTHVFASQPSFMASPLPYSAYAKVPVESGSFEAAQVGDEESDTTEATHD